MKPNKIKEKVLKEVLFNVKFSPVLEPKQFSKLKDVIDLTLAEVNKVIDNFEEKVMKEGKRLSKIADKHFAKGNKTDGRRASSSALTIGINVRRLIREELKQKLGIK